MRRQGKTYKEIGLRLKVGKDRAMTLVMKFERVNGKIKLTTENTKNAEKPERAENLNREIREIREKGSITRAHEIQGMLKGIL